VATQVEEGYLGRCRGYASVLHVNYPDEDSAVYIINRQIMRLSINDF